MCAAGGTVNSTLVLPQPIADELEVASRASLETAGVLLASVVKVDGESLRLLGRRIIWVKDSAYLKRETDGLSIASEGYVQSLRTAEELGAVALWTHTHPGGHAQPLQSQHDRVVDGQIEELFRIRSGSEYYGVLIVSPRPDGFTFSGYIRHELGQKTRIGRLWAVGDRLRLTESFDTAVLPPQPVFDRNVRAFGGAVQRMLGEMHVAVVGCGGTGSVVAEQLVRLGVRRMTLVDPETLSGSNLTRVYGSTPADVGRPKAEVLADHLRRIAPDGRYEPIQSMVTVEATARCLFPSDVIFGCTDDNAGRLVLSRAATYLIVPVIDCGVVLSNDPDGRLTGIDGRVTVLTPGQACLVCRGRIDMARAAAEMMTPRERNRLEHEGYAPALGRIEPAVVAFTTSVGACAVGELLERLVGYGPTPRPSEVLLRCHEREVSTNVSLPRDGHYCHPESGKTGAGITNPFLEQTWPA